MNELTIEAKKLEDEFLPISFLTWLLLIINFSLIFLLLHLIK